MNLSEINKKKDVVSVGMTQQMPISHDAIDKWKKLSQEQAETLAKVTAERNGLLSRKEQGQLEEIIRDVQDRNSKLEKMVVISSVEAVENAQKNRMKQKNECIN